MGAAEGPEAPIKLFYSYSHHDEELRKRLEDHLAGLRWSEKIAEWHDRNIDVGDEWAKEIDRNLTSADIILLLVSASFIASKYCWSVEMKKALERHDKGEAKVIPVILRPCSWHITPFAKLQAVPTDAKPVISWSDPDEALYEVARKIERAVTDLQRQRQYTAEQAQQRAEEAQKRQAAEESAAEIASGPSIQYETCEIDCVALRRRSYSPSTYSFNFERQFVANALGPRGQYRAGHSATFVTDTIPNPNVRKEKTILHDFIHKLQSEGWEITKLAPDFSVLKEHFG